MPTRDTAQLILEVDARIATAQRAVNQLAKAIQQDSANIDKSLAGVEQAHARMGRALNDNGRIRAGFTQLSFQIGDVTQQMSLGVAASRIFAQQSGQVIQALQVMGGEGNKFLQFLGGPWGIAISTSAVILGSLVPKLLENKNEVGALVDKMREQARQAGLNQQADEAWKHTIEGLTDAIRKRRQEQEKGLQTDVLQEQDSLTQARSDISDAQQNLVRKLNQQRSAAAALAEAKRFLGVAEGGTLGTEAVVGAQARVAAAQGEVDRIVGEVNKLQQAVFDAEAEERAAEAKITQRNVQSKYDPPKKAADDYQRTLGTLNRQLSRNIITQEEYNQKLDAAQVKLEAAKTAAKGQFTPVTLSEVKGLLNSNFDLFPESSHQLDQGIHAKNSYHYRQQAIDFVPKGGVSSLTKDEIRKAVEAQGIKILELLGPGDPGHSDHFHLAFDKRRLGPDQITKLQGQRDRTAETAAQRATRQQNAFEEQRDRLNQELLQAQSQLVQGIDAQAAAAEEQARAEISRRDAAIQNDVEEKKISQAHADQLKAIDAQILAERLKGIELNKQLATLRQQDERQQRSFEYQVDDLRFADEMATTQAEHRRLQLEILDVVYQEKLAHLETLKLIAQKNKAFAAEADIQAQIDRLPTDKAQDQERTRRGTMNPLEAWAKTVPQTAAEVLEAIQSIEARGLDSLANSLAEVVMGTKSLGAAFKDIARSIIADIIQMTIKMLIFRAISSAFGGGVFGGGGAAGGPMSFAPSGIIGPRAAGGPVARGSPYIVGDRGIPEVFVPDNNGRVLPSVPKISAPTNNNRAPVPVQVHVLVDTSEDLMIKAAVVADQRIQAHEPRIVRNAAAATLGAATRPRLMGRR